MRFAAPGTASRLVQKFWLALALCAGWRATRAQLLVQLNHPLSQADTSGGADLYATDGVAISADGRYLAHVSYARTLLAGVTDANRDADIYLHDRIAGTQTLVSRSTTPSRTANARSYAPKISADGRFVLFLSYATDLCACSGLTGKTNAFLFDRSTGAVVLVSHAGSLSAAGNGYTEAAEISADGGGAVFASSSTDLLPGVTDANGSMRDVFHYSVATGVVTLVSRGAGSSSAANSASESPSVSDDGRYVAFRSNATNVGGMALDNPTLNSNIYVHDRQSGTWQLLSAKAGSPLNSGNGSSQYPRISGDGGWVVYETSSTDVVSGASDGNFDTDIILAGVAGGVYLVSHRSAMPLTAANRGSHSAVISADGQLVAYLSTALNLVAGQSDSNGVEDAFLYSRASGTNVLISHAAAATTAGDWPARGVRLSADGAYALLIGDARNYGSGISDPNGYSEDLFLYQRATALLTLVSHQAVATTVTGNGASSDGALSATGDWVAFCSEADNLLPGGLVDDGRSVDVFLYSRVSGANALATPRAPGTTLAGAGAAAWKQPRAVDDSGRYAVFTSASKLLVSETLDVNNATDVFLHDRVAGTTRLVSHQAGAPLTSCAPGDYGATDAGISRDGRYIVYVSRCTNLVAGQVDANDDYDVFLYDVAGDFNILVSHAAGAPQQAGSLLSYSGVVSDDGRYVAYRSYASELVAGANDNNNDSDAFLYDRVTGASRLVSHAANPLTAASGPSGYRVELSGDGRYVAFNSYATNVGGPHTDTNGTWDIHLFDAADGSLKLLSHAAGAPATAANGGSYDVWLSAQGNVAVILSLATNLVTGQSDTSGTEDLFYVRPSDSVTALISHSPYSLTAAVGTGSQPMPALSADGSLVAFNSGSAHNQYDLNGGYYDIYLYSSTTGADRIVSLSSGGLTAANSWSSSPLMGLDGTLVVFHSAATNILPGITPVGGSTVAYAYRVADASISLLSGADEAAVAAPDGTVSVAGASADARYVLLASNASNLKSGGAAPDGGLFLRLPCAGPPGAAIADLRLSKSGGGITWNWSDVPGATGYTLHGDPAAAGLFGAVEGVASSGAPGLTLDPAPANSFSLLTAENECGAGPLH